MSDDRPADIGLWATVLVIVGAIVILFVVLLNTAKAEELSEISVHNASFCSLYARQMVFTDMMHGKRPTADTDYILEVARKHYADCLAVLPALMPLPADTGSLKTWLADMRDLLVLTGSERVADAGTKPATEAPSDEEWRRQCRAEYATWDEATGTVIRRGSPDRQPCPCGKGVNCE
jgi:hypothetical protein